MIRDCCGLSWGMRALTSEPPRHQAFTWLGDRAAFPSFGASSDSAARIHRFARVETKNETLNARSNHAPRQTESNPAWAGFILQKLPCGSEIYYWNIRGPCGVPLVLGEDRLTITAMDTTITSSNRFSAKLDPTWVVSACITQRTVQLGSIFHGCANRLIGVPNSHNDRLIQLWTHSPLLM